jgi:aspartate 1-decarboxylase
MQRVIMKSRNHRATTSRASVGFEGSCVSAPIVDRALRDCTLTMLRMGANHLVEQAAIA